MGWWQWTLIAIAVLAAVVGHLEMIEAPPERGLNHLVWYSSVGDAGLDPATPTV
jgi:hypothetical protein